MCIEGVLNKLFNGGCEAVVDDLTGLDVVHLGQLGTIPIKKAEGLYRATVNLLY